MNWSKKYYKGLTNTQHKINDDWFKNMLNYLKDTGILYVPNLKKSFNKIFFFYNVLFVKLSKRF